METEEELLHELRAGSRNAGRRLYERYSGGLMAVCLRYLGGRDEARDVLQNVFVKVLTSLGHFRYQGEGSLKAWMTRITVSEGTSASQYSRAKKTLQYQINEYLKQQEQ